MKKNNIKTDNDKEISERKKIKENNSIAFKNKENSNERNVSGLSLSSIKFKKESKKIQVEISKNSLKKNLEENFTHNELVNIWNVYSEDKLSKVENNIASILKINTPKINNNNNNLINFSVLNDSNKIELEEEKNKLLDFLRKHLKNDNINLNILVNKTAINKTEYSDKEKYKILLKKNSELDKLRTNFDLEF